MIGHVALLYIIFLVFVGIYYLFFSNYNHSIDSTDSSSVVITIQPQQSEQSEQSEKSEQSEQPQDSSDTPQVMIVDVTHTPEHAPQIPLCQKIYTPNHSSLRNQWPVNSLQTDGHETITHTDFEWDSQSVQKSYETTKKPFVEIYNNPTVQNGLITDSRQSNFHSVMGAENYDTSLNQFP